MAASSTYKESYRENFCSVCVRGYKTGNVINDIVVKQGDHQSPGLFLTFIDPLIKHINNMGVGIEIYGRNVGVLAYADDIVLVSNTEAGLKRQLDGLHRWCTENELGINSDKTKVFSNQRRGKRGTYAFTCGEQELEQVHSYKYLE